MEPIEKFSVDELNLSDFEFWALPPEVREGAFKTLRRERPIAYYDLPEVNAPGVEQQTGGYYVLSKYKDIVDASRQPELFCSGKGIASAFDMPAEIREYFGSMIEMDDPRHKRLRDIVSKAFTVRQIRQMNEYVDKAAREIIEKIGPQGEVDFVTDCSSRLPLKVICDMMGVPESQYDFVFDSSNVILGLGDPEYTKDMEDPLPQLMTAAMGLGQLATELAKDRQTNPTDDLLSAIIHAEVDGQKLEPHELASFFILLLVAGNETTRNAISWGLKALTENPDQRKIWMDDFDGVQRSAVEEIVRYASPVMFMRRTVTQDGASLSGHEFKEGDKVMMYYLSGNRDEDVFFDPYTFNVRREPNNHIGFGGPGPHFCLGANLARQEIKVMFSDLFQFLPDIEMSGEPAHLSSTFINGIKHMTARFAPRKAA
ncbi:MAG TPA: cytochrome P450 [Actinomycetota bacterium]|nr:cytochrome P450 [Actinomycetota bacterium]